MNLFCCCCYNSRSHVVVFFVMDLSLMVFFFHVKDFLGSEFEFTVFIDFSVSN